MKISNIPTIQHYVPQFLLKNFGFGSKLQINVFDKSNEKQFLSNTKNIACERYFYNYADNEDLKTLETFFSLIESKANLIIQSIIERKELNFLTYSENYDIASYVASQLLRTKAIRANLEHSMQEFDKILSESGADNIESFYNESMIKTASCNVISKHLPTFTRELLNKNWFLISNETDQAFLLGDNPVTMYNETQINSTYEIGTSIPGIQMYLPLSPKVTLCVYCKSILGELIKTKDTNTSSRELLTAIQRSTHWRAPPDVVTFLNELQIIFSEKYLFSSSNNFSIVKKTISRHPSYKSGLRSTIS